MDTSLSKYLQQFVEVSLKHCKEELDKNVEKYHTLIYVPVLKDGKYCKTEQQKVIDYLWVANESEPILKKITPATTFYNIILHLISHKIKNLAKAQFGDGNAINHDKLAQEKVLEFLAIYMTNFSTKFTKEEFRKIYRKFEMYIQEDLFSIFYFSPLHNFDGDIIKMEIDQDMWIREITAKEFSVISGLIDGTTTKPDPRFTHLRYVIVKRVTKKTDQDNLKIARESFNKIISSFKIFKQGEIQLGGIYWVNSEKWDVENPKKITTEYHNPSNMTYLMTSKDRLHFKKFYSQFERLDLSKKENLFLKAAIRRFDIAIDQRNFEDKIVDFMICLESLFSTKGPDILHKMAYRIALLLEKDFEKRTKLLIFIKKSYEIRSQIVHGDPEPFKIGNKFYQQEDISSTLERITRDSIHAFLELVNEYSSKDLVHVDMDLALLDGKILKKLYMIIR